MPCRALGISHWSRLSHSAPSLLIAAAWLAVASFGLETFFCFAFLVFCKYLIIYIIKKSVIFSVAVCFTCFDRNTLILSLKLFCENIRCWCYFLSISKSVLKKLKRVGPRMYVCNEA